MASSDGEILMSLILGEVGGRKLTTQELIFIYQLREQIGIQKNSLNQKELISLENPIGMLHLQWGIISAWGLH